LTTIALKGKVLINFKDEFISSNEFVRIIGDKKYFFKDNLQVLFLKEVKSKYISKINKSKNMVNKFLTFDIETYVENKELIPYLICVFDGKNNLVFGL
jgi:hypothetical protein